MEMIMNAIVEWLKEILVGGIVSNLSGMFDNVNQQVGDIVGQVSTTPQAWNGSIYSMIRNLSDGVIVPIAGVILAFVMTIELIQMVADRNNMHGDVDTWMFFKWIFKTAAAVLIVTNTWNIVMGVFDVEGKEYIALIPNDGSEDIYLYGYREMNEDEFEMLDIEDDAEFEKVAAEFDRLISEDVVDLEEE